MQIQLTIEQLVKEAESLEVSGSKTETFIKTIEEEVMVLLKEKESLQNIVTDIKVSLASSRERLDGMRLKETEKEGVKTPFHKTTLLVLAITLHNIPEGLAIGVLFDIFPERNVAARVGIETNENTNAAAKAKQNVVGVNTLLTYWL